MPSSWRIRSSTSLLEALQLAHRVGHEGRLHLDLDLDLVERAFAEHDDLVARLDTLDIGEHRLDGRGIDVDAPDDEHVVGARVHLAVPREDPPARAGPVAEAGQVAGAVADHRQRLLGERGEDQLALLAVGHRLAGRRVDHLDQEVVLVDVQAVLVPAFVGDARADDLRQPVDVAGRHARALLDLGARLVGPRLGAEQSHPQVERLRGRTRARAPRR